MFDLQRYNALCDARSICEKLMPWKLCPTRTKLLHVIRYLFGEIQQIECDYLSASATTRLIFAATEKS